MSSRGNIFANLESKFKNASERDIVETALQSTAKFLGAIEFLSDEATLGLMIFGAKLGVAGDGVINSKEKMLIDEVFGRVFKSLDMVYALIDTEIDENTYNIVMELVKIGNSFAIPYLYYILSFAYIDGVFEDEVAERIEHIFGMNLLLGFMESGAESVPSQSYRVSLTPLESRIVRWFKADDTLHSKREIQSEFSDVPSYKVQEALDSLLEKGILYGGENIVGNMYGLASDEVDFVEDDDYDDEPAYSPPKKYESRPIQTKSKYDIEREQLAVEICNVLEDSGEFMTPTEIAQIIGSPVQKVTAVCTKLVADGKVKRGVEKGKSYFRIC